MLKQLIYLIVLFIFQGCTTLLMWNGNALAQNGTWVAKFVSGRNST